MPAGSAAALPEPPAPELLPPAPEEDPPAASAQGGGIKPRQGSVRVHGQLQSVLLSEAGRPAGRHGPWPSRQP